MKASVATETLILENKEVTLVSVTGGNGGFGINNTTRDIHSGIRETFYVGQEAIINTIQRSINDPYSNKIIQQLSSTEKCGDFQRRIAFAVDELYINNKSVTVAMADLFGSLKNGLYAVYRIDMIPTDGAGNYFWNAYFVPHELSGSGTFSSVCKKQRNVNPCFLVPTENIGNYSESMVGMETEKLRKENGYGGIAFHLSGMFCALLSNHHTATAAMMSGRSFPCVVIEPIRSVFFKDEIVPSENEKNKLEPCDYLYTTFVKIPIYKVPQGMLEDFFVRRKTDKSKYFDSVCNGADRSCKLKNKRAFSSTVIEKSEHTPDTEMLQSAAFVDSLSDAELDALIGGQTMLENKIIISSNYYSSVCIACNYLQYTNFDRFLDFAIKIMHNEDLAAVHQYVATRLQALFIPQVKELFTELVESKNSVYEPILPLIDKYLKRYEKYSAKKEEEQKRQTERASAPPEAVLKRDTEMEINALEMAKKLQSVTGGAKK